jgi:photosystem II stability/assembly factor-like uncharacterized protein
VEGTVVWGNIEDILGEPLMLPMGEDFIFGDPVGVEEDFSRQFTGNWELVNITIDGEGNSEKLVLGQPGYALSEPWKTGPGQFHLFKNKYGDGIRPDLPEMEYRTALTYPELTTSEWVPLGNLVNVTSLGFVQIRVIIGASVSSSSSCRSSSSSSSSSSCRSSSSCSSSSSCRSSSSSSSSNSSSSSSSSYAVYFTFNETSPSGLYEGYYWETASDRDGSVLAATSTRLYVSTDGGSNWSEKQLFGDTDQAWATPSISYDGSVIAASTVQYDGYSPTGRLFISTNSGLNWTERQPRGNGDFGWFVTKVSGNGNFILARSLEQWGNPYLHRSTDGGVNWSEIIPTGVRREYIRINCDEDGSHIMLSGYDGKIYISTDSGNNFTDRTPDTSSVYYWNVITNSTGSVIMAATSTGYSGAPNGKVYITTDYGANWTIKNFKTMAVGEYAETVILSMNESGSTIIVSVGRRVIGGDHYNGYFRVSTDGGNNWSDMTVNPNRPFEIYDGGLDLLTLFGTHYKGDESYYNYRKPFIGTRGT